MSPVRRSYCPLISAFCSSVVKAWKQDVALNLQVALETVYSRGGYAAVVDYDAPPPAPPLTPPDTAWVAACLADWRSTKV